MCFKCVCVDNSFQTESGNGETMFFRRTADIHFFSVVSIMVDDRLLCRDIS